MKMKTFHSRWLGMLGALALASSACSDDGQPSLDGGTDGTESAEGGSMTGPSNTTTGATSDDPSGTTTGATDSNDDSNFIDPADDDDGPSEPGPNGSECSANADCTSGYCYVIPGFGGVCSECLMDADCGEGTCSVDFGAGYAICTDGSLGKMCDTDEGCQGELVCAQLIDTGGLFNASFCSECNDENPCAGEKICSPHYDEGSFSGHMACVDPESVESGGGCPIENGEGNDEVCKDGHCGIADIMGFIQLGVCGECSTNEDCEVGETCTPASASQAGLEGASCG
jgi:hypothetical protein